MAERTRFAGGQAATPAISGVPISGGSPLAAEFEQFGQTMFAVGRRLKESYIEKETIKAEQEGIVAGQTGAFAPRRDASRQSMAFNRAGFETYFDNLKITAGDEIDRIYETNRDNPAELESALAGYQEGIETELNKTMPELVTPFRSYFDRSSRPYRRQAGDAYREAQGDQRVANASEFLTAKERQDERLAFLADGSDESIADLAEARNEYLEGLLRLGPTQGFELNGKVYAPDDSRAGRSDPAAIQKALDGYDRMIVGARVKGEFKRAMRAGRGERFVLAFANDDTWLEGGKDGDQKGRPRVTLDERDQLVNWMRGEINDARALRESTDKMLTAAVGAAVDALAKGESPGGLDDLAARVRGTELEAPLRLAIENQDVLNQYAGLPPAQQAESIKAERDSMKALPVGSPDYATETRARTFRIQAMESLQRQTAEALKNDAYGFAVSVGKGRDLPLFAADGALDEDGVSARALEAVRLSQYYGRPVLPLAAAEIDALGSAQLGADPVTRAARTATLASSLPPDQALGVFAAMDKKGYLIDAAAGSMAIDGAPELAQMIYQGDAILQPQDGKASFKFPDADFDLHFASTVGTAFSLNPRAEITIKEAAKRIYVANLARTGNRPDAVVSKSAVSNAIEAVLGGELISHRAGPFGARATTFVTPPFRGATSNDFDDWWDRIDAKAVKAAGGLAGWDHEAAAEIIRERGLPVEIGQGVYKIVIPGAGELDLTATAKSAKGDALVLRFVRER